MFSPRPKPRREWVPLERLLFDPRLQMRDCPDGLTYIDGYVVTYLESLEEGCQFPALEVVEEHRRGKEPLLWVFAGFHRGEAYKRWAKAASVEVLIYPGTFTDAQFYALSENAKQAKERTHGDCRKAVGALLDNDALFRRVADVAKNNGGLHRAIAAACGVSKSTVEDVIRGRCLRVDNYRLVPIAQTGAKPLSGSGQDSNREAIASSPDRAKPLAEQPPPEPGPRRGAHAGAASESGPAGAEGDEPLYTTPRDWSPGVHCAHTPTPPVEPASTNPPTGPDGVAAEDSLTEVKPLFMADRALADQVLRDLKSSLEGIRKLLNRRGGEAAKRTTYLKQELFTRARVRVGPAEREEWVSRHLAVVMTAIRRTRPKVACAGCRGEGCSACCGLGFVPEDESILRGGEQQLTFDFGDLWEGEE